MLFSSVYVVDIEVLLSIIMEFSVVVISLPHILQMTGLALQGWSAIVNRISSSNNICIYFNLIIIIFII